MKFCEIGVESGFRGKYTLSKIRLIFLRYSSEKCTYMNLDYSYWKYSKINKCNIQYINFLVRKLINMLLNYLNINWLLNKICEIVQYVAITC